MTFDEAQNRLDNLTDEQFDKCGRLLANLHKQLLKHDKETADALEIAFQAMTLYCNK